MESGGVTWCRPSAWSRLTSAHRWGWYRYPVAYLLPTVAGELGADATSVPPWIGAPVLAAMGAALLWWLPGPRVGCGYGDDGVHSRRWLRDIVTPWDEVGLIGLGLIEFDSLWRRGGRLGAEILRTNGERRDLRGLPWLGRTRNPTLAPLVGEAQSRRIPIVLMTEMAKSFNGLPHDLVGTPAYLDGAWNVRDFRAPSRAQSAR